MRKRFIMVVEPKLSWTPVMDKIEIVCKNEI